MSRSEIALGLCIVAVAFATLGPVAAAEEPASAPDAQAESDWRTSTGDDLRMLAIRTNDFGGDYEVDQPVPVALELRNLGLQGEEELTYPAAELHPWLDVWIRRTGDPQPYHALYRPPIENRIVIKEGTPVELLFDLRKVVDLSQPGEYRIAIGHDGFFMTSMGDWLGSLKSRERTVRIRAKTAPRIPSLPAIEFPPIPGIEIPDPPKIDLQEAPNVVEAPEGEVGSIEIDAID